MEYGNDVKLALLDILWIHSHHNIRDKHTT